MLKSIFFLFSFSFSIFNCSSPQPSIELGSEKGHLVLIGGGSRPERVMKTIVDLAVKHGNGNIVVIPNASATPIPVGKGQAGELGQLTDKDVSWVNLTPENIDSDSVLSKFDNIGGVFFSGGSQTRLTALLPGTQLLKKIRNIYTEGGVLAGTSAGAAIMSKIMLNGTEKRYTGNDRLKTIEGNNVGYEEGFGFMKGVIIDQHFVKRQRENRLISLVIENPQYIGIGIDEQTAIIRKPDNTFEVIGNSNVLIFDATEANNALIDTTKSHALSASGMKFHVLTEGQVFDLKTLRVKTLK